jgi:hypothetical protein
MDDQPPKPSYDAPFEAMKDRIVHNAGSTFGGAAVIVPPEGGGEPIELLMLDAKGDPAQFWGSIASRIQIVLANLQDQQRNQVGFGRR